VKKIRILMLSLSLILALSMGVSPAAARPALKSAPAPGQILLPANALSYARGGTVITETHTGISAGLLWQASYVEGATWATPRPADWDGTSDVELRLYFYSTSSTAGNVQFFIRPRAYDPGDSYGDAASLSGSAVPVSQNYQVGMQTFSIPAAKFGAKALWMIGLQRGGSLETYPDDILLLALELRYTRLSSPTSQVGLSANALNFDKASTIISQAYAGVLWQASYLNGAYWAAPRPADWDGVSDVEVRLYFYPVNSTAGDVSFFIRPRAYNPGDGFADASSLSSSPVAVSQSSQVRMQSFIIPAAKFGTKAMWMISLQRGGDLETYPSDVVLMAVDLRYTRQGALAEQAGLPANALNYDGAGTVITQAATGLRWQATYTEAAYWMTSRPSYWDGVSDVELRLYFYPVNSNAGNVQFFIRPRAFDTGDAYGDAASLSGGAVAVAQSSQVRMQKFSIPAARFGTDSLWVITLQRDGMSETYTGDVILMAVELRYSPYPVYLPLVFR